MLLFFILFCFYMVIGLTVFLLLFGFSDAEERMQELKTEK